MHHGRAGDGVRRQGWRWVVAFVLVVAGFLAYPSPGVTQPVGVGARQDRLCDRLQDVLAGLGDRGSTSARQALVDRLDRLGCSTSPSTTVLPGSTTTSSSLAATTTTTHLDCQLPGGGVGPCPTTTTLVVPPSTTPTTVPDGSTTTLLPTTTLPPCGSTSTTSTTGPVQTTIPTCMP